MNEFLLVRSLATPILYIDGSPGGTAMQRRTILFIGGVVVLLLGAGLYGLGLYWDAVSVPGDPNIGAGIALMFGEIFGALGVGIVVVAVIAVLVVRLKQNHQRKHGQVAEAADRK